MSLATRVRELDKRLRVMLIATTLLVVPQIGQFVAISDLHRTGSLGTLAFFFMASAIFILPTSAILTLGVIFPLRHKLKIHEPLILLGSLNLLIVLSITWFFLTPCNWASAVGLIVCRTP